MFYDVENFLVSIQRAHAVEMEFSTRDTQVLHGLL
jgi:hypothetical protein